MKSTSGASVHIDDDGYRDRIATAIYEAIVETSRGDDGCAIVRTGACVDALMMVGSLLIAGSPEVNTPQKLARFAEQAARTIRNQVALAQVDPVRAKLFAAVRSAEQPN